MTTPQAARRKAIIAGTALVVLLLIAVGWFILRPGTTPAADEPAAPATAADTAAAFAAAYATGDTPTACSYAAGDALGKLNKNGRCQQKQQWNVQQWQTGTCTLPTGGISFNYGTSSEIDGQRGFEVVLTGADDIYKVTTFIKRNNTSPSLCGIYATKGSAG